MDLVINVGPVKDYEIICVPVGPTSEVWLHAEWAHPEAASVHDKYPLSLDPNHLASARRILAKHPTILARWANHGEIEGFNLQSVVGQVGEPPSKNTPIIIGTSREVCRELAEVMKPRAMQGMARDERLCLSLFINSLAGYDEALFCALYDTYMARGNQPVKNCVLLGVAEGAEIPYMSEHERLRMLYFGLPAPLSEEYVSKWAVSRVRALFSTMSVQYEQVEQMASWEAVRIYSNIIRSDYEIMTILKDYIVLNRLSEDDGLAHIREVCAAAYMIASYSGMTTIRNAYNFAVNNGTAAVLIPLVRLQMRQLVATYEHLMSNDPPTDAINVAGLGENFPFCKALNLPGAELLNAGNFPDLCYAAWFERTMTDEKFKQVKEPECTGKATLRA